MEPIEASNQQRNAVSPEFRRGRDASGVNLRNIGHRRGNTDANLLPTLSKLETGKDSYTLHTLPTAPFTSGHRHHLSEHLGDFIQDNYLPTQPLEQSRDGRGNLPRHHLTSGYRSVSPSFSDLKSDFSWKLKSLGEVEKKTDNIATPRHGEGDYLPSHSSHLRSYYTKFLRPAILRLQNQPSQLIHEGVRNHIELDTATYCFRRVATENKESPLQISKPLQETRRLISLC